MVINVVVLLEIMVEVEFFGYEVGVFIGVDCWCIGWIEVVFGGVLFLDEIVFMLFLL